MNQESLALQNPQRKRVITPHVLAYLSIGIVLFIWSGFALTVRAIGSSTLTPTDVALIRFSIPLALLSPFLRSRLSQIKRLSISHLLLIMLGGVPFFFLAAQGAKTAPTAYIGTILAGASPLFVVMLAYIFQKQRISKKRVGSLSLVAGGIVTMIIGNTGDSNGHILQGVLFLISASITWAAYTLGIRKVALDAIVITILLSFSSLVLLSLLIMTGTVTCNLSAASFNDILPFVLVQGIGVGLIATVCYSYAVTHLGSAKAATIGSISPAITALLAVPIFNEALTITILLGITLTISGVFLANRS